MDDPNGRPPGGSTDPDPNPGGGSSATGPHPGLSATGPHPGLATQGPLSPEEARAILDRAGGYGDVGDWEHAAAHYRRVIGHPDPPVTAAALLGLGQALYRLDNEDSALAAWEAVLELPETPSTYRAWREVAAARVRDGDLQGAIAAYREADRRAPHDDKAEIANRLGWLAKETGNTGAARRYFAKGRGDGPIIPLTWIILGITVIVSVSALSSVEGQQLYDVLALDKQAVAAGEYWRLWTITLLHGDWIHLAFNMYALYLMGPLVEQLYGARLFLLFYLLTAAAGSVASFVLGDNPAVGASGAIFGLVGDPARRFAGPQPGPRSARAGTHRAARLPHRAQPRPRVCQPRDRQRRPYRRAPRRPVARLPPRPGPRPDALERLAAPGRSRRDATRAQSVLRVLGVLALVLVLVVGIVIGTEERRVGGAELCGADGGPRPGVRSG